MQATKQLERNSMQLSQRIVAGITTIGLTAILVAAGTTSASAALSRYEGPFASGTQCNTQRHAFQAEYSIVGGCFKSTLSGWWWFAYDPTSIR